MYCYFRLLPAPKAIRHLSKPETLHTQGYYQPAYSKTILANESPSESELASLLIPDGSQRAHQ